MARHASGQPRADPRRRDTVIRPLHLATTPGEPVNRQVVATTLRWADEAAARRDFGEALHWLRTVTAIGEELPDGYAAKHLAWQTASSRADTHAPVRHRGGRTRSAGSPDAAAR